MPDMICSLLSLPDIRPELERLRERGITIRRPHPWERTALAAFITEHFTVGWADEVTTAFSHQPVTAFVAVQDGRFVGFAAYECSRRNYFGPTGVPESLRGLGIGKALFLACLMGLQDLGYAYCIIGAAGPVDFYRKVAGAEIVPFENTDGIYKLSEDPKFRIS